MSLCLLVCRVTFERVPLVVVVVVVGRVAFLLRPLRVVVVVVAVAAGEERGSIWICTVRTRLETL